MIFLDTNIVLYAFGHNDDIERSAMARSVLFGASVSVQVLAEFSSVLSRGNRRSGIEPNPWTQIDTAVALLCGMLERVVPLNQDDQRYARRIADTNNLSYYDAQIIAVAVRNGGTVLLSEDMNHGQVIDRLEIRNPFL